MDSQSTPETVEQSNPCTPSVEWALKSSKTVLSAEEVMVTSFRGTQGLIDVDYMEEDQTAKDLY